MKKLLLALVLSASLWSCSNDEPAIDKTLDCSYSQVIKCEYEGGLGDGAVYQTLFKENCSGDGFVWTGSKFKVGEYYQITVE